MRGAHVKKVHPEPFAAMVDGRKAFEWRKEADCSFRVGDLLILLEYEPGGWNGLAQVEEGYTGQVIKRRVTYVLRGQFDVPNGYVVLGLESA